jgi:hypothetical protein
MVDVPGLTNVSFHRGMGGWVIWDGDLSTADATKQLHPYDPVFLYDRETKQYTRYTVEVPDRKRIMKNGKFVYVDEDAVKEY